MAYTFAQLNDANNFTRDHYVKNKVVDVAQPYREAVLANLLLMSKPATAEHGSSTIEAERISSGMNYKSFFAPVATDYSSEASPNERFDYSSQDNTVVASTPRKAKKSTWKIDALEDGANQGDEALASLMQYRRMRAYKDLIFRYTTAFGTAPSATSNTAINSIPYHVTKSATTPGGGFTGGNLSGFSDWCGLSRTTYPNLCNWSFNYTQVSKGDLISLIRKAMLKTHFFTPSTSDIDAKEYDCVLLTNDTVWLNCNALLEAQNLQLGDDLYRFSNSIMLARTPLIPCPEFEADTSNPVYGINKKELFPVFFDSATIFERPAIDLENFYGIGIGAWCQMNLACTNPQSQFVGYVA